MMYLREGWCFWEQMPSCWERKGICGRMSGLVLSKVVNVGANVIAFWWKMRSLGDSRSVGG